MSLLTGTDWTDRVMRLWGSNSTIKQWLFLAARAVITNKIIFDLLFLCYKIKNKSSSGMTFCKKKKNLICLQHLHISEALHHDGDRRLWKVSNYIWTNLSRLKTCIQSLLTVNLIPWRLCWCSNSAQRQQKITTLL